MAVMPLTRVHLPPPYPRPHAPHKSDPSAPSAPSDQPSLTHLFTYSLIHSLRPYTLPSSLTSPATASTNSLGPTARARIPQLKIQGTISTKLDSSILNSISPFPNSLISCD